MLSWEHGHRICPSTPKKWEQRAKGAVVSQNIIIKTCNVWDSDCVRTWCPS